jgi:hypothetical protein
LAAHNNGATSASQRAYDMLRSFDTRDHHPTVERGRLIGLAVLGDWPPILTGLTAGDPRLHTAAHNAIDLWTPGPYTPSWGREPAEIAGWIAARLSDPQLSETLPREALHPGRN